ncbi:hypothetical protein NKG94_47455 [Micromonospora sp. M12]
MLDFLHPLPADALWGWGARRRGAPPTRPDHGRRPRRGAGGHAPPSGRCRLGDAPARVGLGTRPRQVSPSTSTSRSAPR